MGLRSLAFLGFSGSFLAFAGCGLADAEKRTLSMSVDAAPLVVDSGVPVTIRTDATGQSLVRTVVEYGDGKADSINTVGSEHKTSRTYKYSSIGPQTIRATAFDAVLGETFDEVTITVQAPGN